MNVEAEVLTLGNRVASLEATDDEMNSRVDRLEAQLRALNEQPVGSQLPAGFPAPQASTPKPTPAPTSQLPTIPPPPNTQYVPQPPPPVATQARPIPTSGVLPPPLTSPSSISLPSTSPPSTSPPSTSLPSNQYPVAYPQPLPPQKSTVTSGQSLSVTSETLLRWVGLALVSLAAIFFVSTAINRGWIGPKLQLAGATAVGLGLHGAAIRLEKRARNWAHTMAHGATVVLAWSAAASYQWLGLVSFEVAMALVAVATLGSTAIALRYRFSAVALNAGVVAMTMPLWMDLFDIASASTVTAWYAIIGVSFAGIGLWKQWSEVRIPIPWISTSLLLLAVAVGDSFDGSQGRAVGMVGLTALMLTLWLSPWIHTVVHLNGKDRPEFIRLIEAVDHRSTLSLPSLYLAGAALIMSTGNSTGIGELALMVAGGFAGLLAIAVLAAPPSMISNRGRIASSFSEPLPTSRRWAMPNSLAVSHLFGIGTVLAIAAVDLLDGPTLLVVVALQALGSAGIAVYFKDIILGLKSIVLGVGTSVVATVWMIDAIGQSAELDQGKTLANLVVVATLIGFGILSRFVVAESTPGTNLGAKSGAEIGDESNGSALSHSITWQWWSRNRPVVEAVDGIAWAVGLIWIASVITPLVDFSLAPGLLALFGVLSVLAYRFFGRAVLAVGIGLCSISLFLAGVGILVGYSDELGVVSHLNHLVVVVSFLLAAIWAWTHSPSSDGQASGTYDKLAEDPMRASLFVVAWIGVLSWLGSIVIFGPQGQVVVSASWALAGCLALIAGIRFNEPTIRLTGLTTLGVVVVKLLTVDLAEVDTLWRVGLFFVLGLSFMRLGYVLPTLAKRYSAEEELSSQQPV